MHDHIIMPRRLAQLCATVLLVGFALWPERGSAATYSIDHANPLMDIWEYPFATSGTRLTASTFGSVNDPDFDDRDGQFFMAFGTGDVPTGLDPSSYSLLSATLTLTMSVSNVVFDGTYDPIGTYSADGSPVNDDPGRPMELYGASYRNGVTSSTVTESTPFNPDFNTGAAARSVFPTDFYLGGSLDGATGGRDVSRNVRDGFDPAPFSIGQVAPDDLQDDGTISAFTEVTFKLDLTNLDVLHYLQLSLQDGRVAFVASSLFKTVMGGGDGGFPSYYTKEFSVQDAPHLDLQVAVIPEPSPVTLVLCVLGAGAILYRAGGMREGKAVKRSLQFTVGFTLIEMMAVIAIIFILSVLIHTGIVYSRRVAGQAREVHCAKQLVAAYLDYAAAHDGELLPGYGNFPAKDEQGITLENPVNARYPWRLAPYFNYDMQLLWGSSDTDELARLRNADRENYVYRLSVEPALGLNTVFLGGDYQILDPTSTKGADRYGEFCVTRLSQAISPGRLLVFASAGGNYQGGETLTGFFKVLSPFFNSRTWAGSYSTKLNPASYGNVDFRFDERAVTAMLDGHVELLNFEQLNDMRRWSNQAAAADNPRWTLGQ